MQFIVDKLFVGNNFVAGEIRDVGRRTARSAQYPLAHRRCSARRATTSRRPSKRSDGFSIFMRRRRYLGHGQTIVYTIHESVGHLGIFVSGGVGEEGASTSSSSNIDLIDMLPPGLYEAVFEVKTDDTANPDLVAGDWVMRCEARNRSTTSARSAATMRPTSDASPPPPASPRSISRFTARSRSRWCAP